MRNNFNHLHPTNKVLAGVGFIVFGGSYFITRYFDSFHYLAVAWMILIGCIFVGVKLILDGVKGRRKKIFMLRKF
jgi:hypothetical protein